MYSLFYIYYIILPLKAGHSSLYLSSFFASSGFPLTNGRCHAYCYCYTFLILYQRWLQDWNNHMQGKSMLVSLNVLYLHTSQCSAWSRALQAYPCISGLSSILCQKLQKAFILAMMSLCRPLRALERIYMVRTFILMLYKITFTPKYRAIMWLVLLRIYPIAICRLVILGLFLSTIRSINGV